MTSFQWSMAFLRNTTRSEEVEKKNKLNDWIERIVGGKTKWLNTKHYLQLLR